MDYDGKKVSSNAIKYHGKLVILNKNIYNGIKSGIAQLIYSRDWNSQLLLARPGTPSDKFSGFYNL